MGHRDVLAWSQLDCAVPHTSGEIMTWLDATIGSASAMGQLVAMGMYRSAKKIRNKVFPPQQDLFPIISCIPAQTHLWSAQALSASGSLSPGPVWKIP